MGVNNFNAIAPIYDFLARIVFGDSLDQITKQHLTPIGTSDRVLILGGGTGKILNEIPDCQSIDFLDKSSQMIERARKRSAKNNLQFIHGDILEFEFNELYDVIVCPFFLDCFNVGNLQKVIKKCKYAIKEDGKLIVIDFSSDHANRLLIKLMHSFFRLFTRLESQSLKNINEYVLREGFQVQEEKFLHRNMLFSRLYRNL